jgi:hypothetical protein
VITYAERACFGARHMEILARVEEYVARVLNVWGNELRCHELARAMHLVLDERKLDLVDGKCGPIEHRWLRFNDGVILDAYVPGRLPSVQIIDPMVAVAYRQGKPRNDIQQQVIDRLVREMRDAAS